VVVKQTHLTSFPGKTVCDRVANRASASNHHCYLIF